MNEVLKAGIIGCGNITLNDHAPALKLMKGVRVTAIADPVEVRRSKVQALLGLPDSACFADHRALLDIPQARRAREVDYVILAVPQQFRRPIVEDCARAGVHVLSEKPIATVPADARAMIQSMRDANLRYGMVHNYLFYPEYALAKELIDSGAIGTLRHVTLNFLGMPDHPGAVEYRPFWRKDPMEAGGGILMDMVHVIYLAEFFFGGPSHAVSAIVDNLDHAGDAVEDFALVNYVFDTGYATVNLWWGEGPGGLEIGGTRGRILAFYDNYATGPFTQLASFTLVNGEGRQVSQFQPRTERRTTHPLLQLDGSHETVSAGVENFARVHADFVEAIRDGRDPIAPAEAGLRALEAALAAYASSATGRALPLPLSPGDPIFERGVMGLHQLPLWEAGPVARRGLFGVPVADSAPGRRMA